MEKPNLLHIETSAELCSVCVSNGAKILASALESEKYSHSAVITVLIKDVCERAGVPISDLDAVSVSAGPGSYTGLRVGMSTAKSICFAKSIPLIGVSTLESLIPFDERRTVIGYIPMVDARRQEVYYAHFDNQGSLVIDADNLILSPDSFKEELEKGIIIFSGNGSIKFKEICKHANAVFSDMVTCKAEYLVPVANRKFQNKDFEDIAYFPPIYIKPPNITKPKNKLV